MGLLQVLQRRLFAEQLLEDHRRQSDVQDAAVVNRESQHNADQSELRGIFKRMRIEPEEARVFVIREHTCRSEGTTETLAY